MSHPVVLDPGHGGDVAVGKSTPHGRRGADGQLERDVAFAVAEALAADLGGGGATLTRPADGNRSLGARIALARDGRASAFVSLHADHGDADGGAQVWVHAAAGARSLALARELLRGLDREGEPRRGQLAILDPLRHAEGTAACLVELGDLADPATAARLADPAGRRALVAALRDALRAFAAPATALDAPEWTAYRDPPVIIAQYTGWTCWAAALDSWSNSRPGPGYDQRELLDGWASVKPIAGVPVGDPTQPPRAGSLEPKDFPFVADEVGLDYEVIAASSLTATRIATRLREHGLCVLVFDLADDGAAHTLVIYGVGYPDGDGVLMVSVMNPLTAAYENIPLSRLRRGESVILGWPEPPPATGGGLATDADVGDGLPDIGADEAAAVAEAMPAAEGQSVRRRGRALASAYDRDAAVAYAREHAFRVCSDGFIAGSFRTVFFRKVPLDTAYEPDGAGHEHAVHDGRVLATWAELDDCAHFVSCCIGTPPGGTGGGLTVLQPRRISAGPPHAPYGLVSAPGLKAWLAAATDIAEIVADRSSDESLIARLDRGDVILYHNGRGYQHSAVYLGDGLIACHTACRLDAAWQIDAGRFSWTFIHLKDG